MTDSKLFKQVFDLANELYDGKMRAPDVWWTALRPYPMENIKSAFNDHIHDPKTGRFAPKPADIIARVQQLDGHLGVEEAWTMVKSNLGNEDVTMVLAAPQYAAFLVADALWDDKIAARMAFKEKYEVELFEARKRGGPVEYKAILGFDKQQRNEVVKQGVVDGKLLPDYASGLLAITDETISYEQILSLAPPAIQKQLLGAVKPMPNGDA